MKASSSWPARSRGSAEAITPARNLGHDVSDFATANLGFIQSYRPNTNVGRGYSVTGHHEILVPLLAAALVEKAWWATGCSRARAASPALPFPGSPPRRCPA